MINTIAPISIDHLKQYFQDKTTFYSVDYKESKLKGQKFLTYFSNLEIPADVDLSTCTLEEKTELLKEYLHCEMLCNLKTLEVLTLNVLLEHAGVNGKSQYSEFIEANTEILDQWLERIQSLPLYNMYILGQPELTKFVESHETCDTNTLVGVNFVNLIKHEELSQLYFGKPTYFKAYFNEYMFKGKNLFSYWANDNNKLFLLTFGISEGLITGESYSETVKQTYQELQDVSSVQ